jgi:hypothetical protein
MDENGAFVEATESRSGMVGRYDRGVPGYWDSGES